MEKESNERQTIYKDPEIANLLVDILKKGADLEAQSDITYGYRYPDIEKSMGKTPQETIEFLKKLSHVGILSEKLSNMIIHCPSCNNANISTHYTCPFCNSPRVNRNALIEHITCGYIDNLSAFRTQGNLVCPKCKAPLTKDSYRSAGKWYECLDCKKRIETPRVSHTCRACNERFTFDEANYNEVYKYSLSEAATTEIRNGALFSSYARSYFSKHSGNQVFIDHLKGESGIQHRFDVVLQSKEGKYVAIDHLFSMEPIGQEDILKEYGKAFDAKVQLYIVTSKITDDAAKLAKNLGLHVIVGELSDSLTLLNETLEKIYHSRK